LELTSYQYLPSITAFFERTNNFLNLRHLNAQIIEQYFFDFKPMAIVLFTAPFFNDGDILTAVI